MRLAVFTSQFPSRVSTFFARDMRGLIAAGIEIEVFPLHPLDVALWRYVPEVLGEEILPRERVHHTDALSAFSFARAGGRRSANCFLRYAASVGSSAIAGGPGAIAKSAYALAKAWAWAGEHGGRFDHVLAYWGNYAATAAIAFQRLVDPSIPVSMFLHAGTDLYRRPVSLRKKLLYVDNVIVVCDFNRGYVEQRYPEIRERIAGKVHVHHPGLDIPAIPCTEDDRRPGSLLAVGSFERAKGFDDLLRAVALLRRRGSNVAVDLVGDGRQAGALRRLASRLGIEAAVCFRGWLPFDEVQRAMRAATLLAHPSIGLGDAVPTVIKEAMAVGTPVVASAVAGIPELLDGGRCGLLVPARNAERLAEAIAELLGDETRRRQLARAARAFAVENFDMWRNGRRLAEILRSTRRVVRGEAA